MSLSTLESPISRKSVTSLKHQYLLWFKHIGASDSGLISIPKSLKSRPWNPSCRLGGPIHEKVIKMTPKWVPRGTQNRSKIDKNRYLDTKVPHWVAQGTPGLPKWCPEGAKVVHQGAKRAPQGAKIEPPSLPRGRFGLPVLPVLPILPVLPVTS